MNNEVQSTALIALILDVFLTIGKPAKIFRVCVYGFLKFPHLRWSTKSESYFSSWCLWISFVYRSSDKVAGILSFGL